MAGIMPSPPYRRNEYGRYNRAMDIQLNGQRHHLPGPCTIAALLDQLGLAERRVAVERNGQIVPRGRHADTTLTAGDRIEIVHAIGGG